MKTLEARKHRPMKSLILRLAALALVLCLLPASGLAEEADNMNDWVTFLLICNEGMNNDKGNAGNTLMVVSMNPDEGKIRLMMFTWDTFVNYEGYDIPQKLDMPYRNNGPEEAMKVFNANFDMNIEHFMSLNYLNLASMIDEYGGVNVDISRAERNALNGMVGSKKNRLQEEVAAGRLGQNVVDMLAAQYYLTDFGPDTHLNGLQAVGFGWLQYDSVYNCCEREVEVIASLFHSVGEYMADKVILYTNESSGLENPDARRTINLDEMSEEDYAFLRQLMDPIFQMSYHNLTEEEIQDISMALARIAYKASRQGVNIFDSLYYTVLPLEATQPYDLVAGTQGHLIDKDANIAHIREFLFSK